MFFCDSTLTSIANPRISLYASGAVAEDYETHTILAPSQYQANSTSGRERALVKRLDVNINMYTGISAGLHAFNVNVGIMLWRGAPDDILDDIITPLVNPWGTTGQLVDFQNLPRGVKLLKRKRFNLTQPAVGANANPEERLLSNVAEAVGMPRFRVVNLTARNFWLKEPETVRMSIWTLKESFTNENPSLTAGVQGWHTTKCTYRTW